jgi:hypothetical protein
VETAFGKGVQKGIMDDWGYGQRGDLWAFVNTVINIEVSTGEILLTGCDIANV